MCLLPFDELGSIETESPEELKRIVENVYKIARIEVRDIIVAWAALLLLDRTLRSVRKIKRTAILHD